MNPKGIGELAESAVIAALVSKGVGVSLPIGRNLRYDIVADVDGVLERIQIKHASYRKGCVRFATKSTNGITGESRSYSGQIEVFLAYCPKTGGVYRVPVELVPAGECCLRVEPAKNNIKEGVRWARDYLWATVKIEHVAK